MRVRVRSESASRCVLSSCDATATVSISLSNFAVACRPSLRKLSSLQSPRHRLQTSRVLPHVRCIPLKVGLGQILQKPAVLLLC